MRFTANRNWKVQGMALLEVYISMDEDVSHHGSPMYDYTEVSNNPKWAELYKAFERLEEYMNYADSPQWERHLEPEQEEAQNGPSMTM